MYLDELFSKTPHIEINQLSIDSRLPMKDCVFFCLSGIKYNGHQYVDEAIKNGANVIVYEEKIKTNGKAIFIKVSNVADCLNDIAKKFYGNPSSKLDVYLSCGCGGTSSITYILTKLLNKFSSCAAIGINGIHYADHHLLCSVPTLTILENQKYLNEFVRSNVKSCMLESTPLSLSFKKLDSIKPKVFIYTNTNEKSNEFEEIEINYFDALCNYLYTLDDSTSVLLNRDDKSYSELAKACGENVYTYGFNSLCDFKISDVVLSPLKSSFSLTYKEVKYYFETKLIGLNNIYNIVSCLASMCINNYDLSMLCDYLKEIEPLEGVFEPIDVGQNYNVIVDCANDTNSIESLFDFANKITKKNKRIFAVYGINANDDIDIVKELAFVSENYIDHLYLTENNSYNGNPFVILKDIKKIFNHITPIVIENRQVAIESAIQILNEEDTLLLLGKGNENFIIRNLGKETYKGDKNIAIEAINKRMDEEKSNYFD